MGHGRKFPFHPLLNGKQLEDFKPGSDVILSMCLKITLTNGLKGKQEQKQEDNQEATVVFQDRNDGGSGDIMNKSYKVLSAKKMQWSLQQDRTG